MSKTDINISKTNIIDKRCDEMFIPVSRSKAFLDTGIHAGGISDLRGEYVISRHNPKFAVLLYTLSNSDQRVEEIADNIGYANEFSFSKAFKRWKGLPPGEYRQSLKHTKSP